MRSTTYTFAIALLFLAASETYAQHGKYVSSHQSVAFEGYDLVSYFAGATPIKGSKDHRLQHDGLTLYFANRSNLETFRNDPQKYLPAYGGYCATAVSHDSYVVPDFTNYSIEAGELHFFEVRGFFNGRTQWQKDPQLYEILADKHYKNKLEETEGLSCD